MVDLILRETLHELEGELMALVSVSAPFTGDQVGF